MWAMGWGLVTAGNGQLGGRCYGIGVWAASLRVQPQREWETGHGNGGSDLMGGCRILLAWPSSYPVVSTATLGV